MDMLQVIIGYITSSSNMIVVLSAGGLLLAMCCDYRIVIGNNKDSLYFIPGVELGLHYTTGSSVIISMIFIMYIIVIRYG